MAITTSQFRTRFPEFDAICDNVIDMFITDAELFVQESYWGPKYDLGLYYLTAHFIAKQEQMKNSTPGAGSSQPSGAITSRAVDGVSVGYSNPFSSSSGSGKNRLVEFESTVYGQRYIQLIRTLGIPAIVV